MARGNGEGRACGACQARRARHAPNALTVKDAFEEWFADQIEPNYRRTNNTRVYVARAIAEFGDRRLQELSRPEIARAVPETREQFNGRRPLLFRAVSPTAVQAWCAGCSSTSMKSRARNG